MLKPLTEAFNEHPRTVWVCLCGTACLRFGVWTVVWCQLSYTFYRAVKPPLSTYVVPTAACSLGIICNLHALGMPARGSAAPATPPRAHVCSRCASPTHTTCQRAAFPQLPGTCLARGDERVGRAIEGAATEVTIGCADVLALNALGHLDRHWCAVRQKSSLGGGVHWGTGTGARVWVYV